MAKKVNYKNNKKEQRHQTKNTNKYGIPESRYSFSQFKWHDLNMLIKREMVKMDKKHGLTPARKPIKNKEHM